MTDRALPATLVVAADSQRRKALEEAALTLGPVLAVSPRDLEPVTRFLDVLAIVLEVSPDEASRAAELFDPVVRLPAWGQASILVDGGLPPSAIASLLAGWEPARVLQATAGEAALRYTIGQLHRAQAPQSARVAHRPARALLGVSAAIRDLLREVRKVASANVPVLISGETGTGKELVARAIHREGKRCENPFVAVNCGALAESLLEAELFGHVKGAFTGADRDKPGLFEQADGGTLFLDEIGDTTPALQVKLLRAIEEGEIRRVGDTRPRHVEVRIVSATHQDLEAAVDARTFREDLFYRLNTFTLHVPPLRRRRIDIPFLAQHFAEEYGSAHARRIVLSEDFLEGLERHDFPGNVRELRNAVDRAITMATPGEALTAEHLPNGLGGLPKLLEIGTLKDRVMQVELLSIREALERFEGNRTRAAEMLGLSRVGLRNKMRRFGLE